MLFIFHRDRDRDRSYHWHRECDHIPDDIALLADWQRSNLAPGDRDQCSTCRALDGKREQTPAQPKQLAETVPIVKSARRG